MSQVPMLRGIVPPMITPLLNRDHLDPAGLERLLQHIAAAPVTGLFILGTSGEGQALGDRLCRELIQQVCRQLRRLPVLVGITHTAFSEAKNLARFAADQGAAATVIAAPYAMAQQQAELQSYLASLVAQSPLPVYLYNYPPLTRTTFPVETIRWAVQQPKIAGVKDSSGDLGYFRELAGLLAQRPDWSLLVGPEELLAESVAAGGHGGVCGGANLFPALYVALYEAAQKGQTARVQELQSVVRLVVQGLYKFESSPVSFLKGIKAALEALNVCGSAMAEPFKPLGPEFGPKVREVLDQVRDRLKTLGLPV